MPSPSPRRLRPTVFSLALGVLAAASALAQTPTWPAVNTGLDPLFSNPGKGITDPQVFGITGIAYGTGLFLVIANSYNEDVIRWATSPDGTTWTPRSQTIGGGMKSWSNSKVHFLNGKFMFFAVHSTPNLSTTWVYTSADGLTWTANKVSDGRPGFEEFDSSSSLTVLAGSNGGQMVSSDLVNWTARPVIPNGAGYDHLDLAYGSGRFFSSINGFGGTTYSSADAVTWTSLVNANVAGGSRVETGNGLVIISAGDNRYRSTDGVNFTKFTQITPAGWYGPGGVLRFTGGRFLASGSDLSAPPYPSGYLSSPDGQNWTPLGLLPAAPAPLAGQSRSYGIIDLVFGAGKYVLAGADITYTASSTTYRPLIIIGDPSSVPAGPPISTQPTAAQSVATGGTATFTVAATGTGLTYQWYLNGTAISGATAATYTRTNVQPAHAGAYSAIARNTLGGTTTSLPAILAITSTAKVAGTGTEFAANIVHANGNVYDQILLNGPAATVTADPGQVLRTSYIDLSDDIVQIEFSGPGSLTITLENVSGPAVAVNYNQPTVQYVKGHATLTLAGATENTHVSAFTVGTATAVNQALFKAGVIYDGVADLALLNIVSPTNRLGSIRMANTEFSAASGLTGVNAPGVRVGGPANLHNISAGGSASPLLLTGTIDSGQIGITGGDLLQPNGKAIEFGTAQKVAMLAGATSHGVAQPAQINKGVLSRDGVIVTGSVIQNP